MDSDRDGPLLIRGRRSGHGESRRPATQCREYYFDFCHMTSRDYRYCSCCGLRTPRARARPASCYRWAQFPLIAPPRSVADVGIAFVHLIAAIFSTVGRSTTPITMTITSTSSAGVTSNEGFHATAPVAAMRWPPRLSTSSGERFSMWISAPDFMFMSTVDVGATTMNFTPW